MAVQIRRSNSKPTQADWNSGLKMDDLLNGSESGHPPPPKWSRTNRAKQQFVTRSELAGTLQITLPLCFTNEETETRQREKTKSANISNMRIYMVDKPGLKTRLLSSQTNELSISPPHTLTRRPCHQIAIQQEDFTSLVYVAVPPQCQKWLQRKFRSWECYRELEWDLEKN